MSEESIIKRLKIVEAALRILTDKYISEGCFDKDDKLPTEITAEELRKRNKEGRLT